MVSSHQSLLGVLLTCLAVMGCGSTSHPVQPPSSTPTAGTSEDKASNADTEEAIRDDKAFFDEKKAN